jgi:hypothetical protein
MVDLTIGKRWDGTTWVDVLPTGGSMVSVTPDSTSAYGEGTSIDGKRPARIYTNYVTLSVSGGTAPYTYSWSYVSGDTAIQCQSPIANSTRWYANLYPDTMADGVWKCTVTDSATNSTDVYIGVELYCWA